MFMTNELTPLAQKMVEVLQAAGGEWVSRSAIADGLERSKSRLNPYDVTLIEQLVSDGTLEATDRKIGTVKTERVYRVKSGN